MRRKLPFQVKTAIPGSEMREDAFTRNQAPDATQRSRCQSINDLTEFDRSAMKLKIIVCSHIPRKFAEVLPLRASCELSCSGIGIITIGFD